MGYMREQQIRICWNEIADFLSAFYPLDENTQQQVGSIILLKPRFKHTEHRDWIGQDITQLIRLCGNSGSKFKCRIVESSSRVGMPVSEFCENIIWNELYFLLLESYWMHLLMHEEQKISRLHKIILRVTGGAQAKMQLQLFWLGGPPNHNQYLNYLFLSWRWGFLFVWNRSVATTESAPLARPAPSMSPTASNLPLPSPTSLSTQTPKRRRDQHGLAIDDSLSSQH